MNRKLIRYAAALAVVIGLGACEKQLEVTNPDNPDTDRVLRTPLDAENLIAAQYKRYHDGLYRTLGSFHGMANMLSLQNYSSLANNCQNSRTPFSNATNSNNPGNVCQGEQNRLYTVLIEVVRSTSSVMTRMGDGLKIGTPSRDLRARSFAEFLRGVSLGYIALFYDSAAVVSEGMTSVDPGVLMPHTQVMDSAYAALQRAIDHANDPVAIIPGADGFPLPATWIPTNALSKDDFIRLIRSYRARFRANVARTPVERAAADWPAVIADVQAGITADHMNVTNTTTGPFYTWAAQYDGGDTWHQMPPFIIGMADTSNNYRNWIATPLGDRGAGNSSFFMATPDVRFPQGATRALQQADFGRSSCQAANTRCKRYFWNRTSGGDVFSGAGWGWSNYNFVRNASWRVSGDGGTGQNGALPFVKKAEMDLLAAEGHIRLGDYASAATLINNSRVPGMVRVGTTGTDSIATGGGLPAVLGTVDGGLSGNVCVPRVPTPAGNSTQCGDLMEAMKYEKRIETAFQHFAAWFLDSRGWGDLPETTPLYWAVPYQDQLARGKLVTELYGTGVGPGNAPNSAAAKGTYGW